MPERSGLDDPELRDFGTLDRARKAVALSGEAVRKRAIHCTLAVPHAHELWQSAAHALS